MRAKGKSFIPSFETDGIRLYLSAITSSEEAEEEGFSVDAYHFSKAAQYCLYDSSNDPFFLSLVMKHGIVSESSRALQSEYIPRTLCGKRILIDQVTKSRLDRMKYRYICLRECHASPLSQNV